MKSYILTLILFFGPLAFSQQVKGMLTNEVQIAAVTENDSATHKVNNQKKITSASKISKKPHKTVPHIDNKQTNKTTNNLAKKGELHQTPQKSVFLLEN